MITMTEQLRCTVSIEPDRAVLWVRGEVDIATADQFREAALAVVRQWRRVVFDVEGAMLLDASGLRVLGAVSCEARRLGHPVPGLRGVRPLLAKSLKATGLLDSFVREPAAPFSRILAPAGGHHSALPGIRGNAAAA
jgi:anti-anti-sigma factor